VLTVLLTLGWTLFAFGGVYAWAATPVLPLAVLAAVSAPAQVWAPGTRALDAALLGVLAVPLVQLWGGWSTDAAATRVTLGVWTAAACLFWTARALSLAALERVVIGIAGLGLAAGLVSLTRIGAWIYGSWAPHDGGVMRAQPFVGAADACAWLVLAGALTAGLLLDVSVRRGVIGLAGLGTMAAWMVATGSRGGLLALGVACAAFAVALMRWGASEGRVGLVVGLLAGGPLGYATHAIVAADRGAGRWDIWAWSWATAQSVPWVGTGMGAWPATQLIWVPEPYRHGVMPDGLAVINYAHNQGLQWVVEGGLLFLIPALLLVGLLLRAGIRRLRAGDGLWGLRVGAAAGLCGLAAHSVFESSAGRPAVLLLASVALAILIRADHEEVGDGRQEAL